MLTGPRRDVYYSSEHTPIDSVNIINVSNAIFNQPVAHQCVPGALPPPRVLGYSPTQARLYSARAYWVNERHCTGKFEHGVDNMCTTIYISNTK